MICPKCQGEQFEERIIYTHFGETKKILICDVCGYINDEFPELYDEDQWII